MTEPAPTLVSEPQAAPEQPTPPELLEPDHNLRRAAIAARWTAVAFGCCVGAQLVAVAGAAGARGDSPIRGAAPFLLFGAVVFAVLAIAALITARWIRTDPAVRLAFVEAAAARQTVPDTEVERQLAAGRERADRSLRARGLVPVPAGERRRPSPHRRRSGGAA